MSDITTEVVSNLDSLIEYASEEDLVLLTNHLFDLSVTSTKLISSLLVKKKRAVVPVQTTDHDYKTENMLLKKQNMDLKNQIEILKATQKRVESTLSQPIGSKGRSAQAYENEIWVLKDTIQRMKNKPQATIPESPTIKTVVDNSVIIDDHVYSAPDTSDKDKRIADLEKQVMKLKKESPNPQYAKGMGHKRIDGLSDDEIVKLYDHNNGLSVKQLSAMKGITEEGITKILKKKSVWNPKKRGKNDEELIDF